MGRPVKTEQDSKPKKCKFEVNLALSHKEITDKRSALLNEDARIDSSDFIRTLTDKKRELTRKLMNLEDFHPDSTMTLRVTKDGFDSKTWVLEMNDTKYKLRVLEEKLKIAEDIHQEYFG